MLQVVGTFGRQRLPAQVGWLNSALYHWHGVGSTGLREKEDLQRPCLNKGS